MLFLFFDKPYYYTTEVEVVEMVDVVADAAVEEEEAEVR